MDRDAERAYGRHAAEYTSLFGTLSATSQADREAISKWSQLCTGTILDAGCGPGQWSGYLADEGCVVEGLDPVQAFVDHARHRHPRAIFRQGTFADLSQYPGRYGGVLSWYSLIHLDPVEVPEVLAIFRSCLVSGGRLMLGFFDGDEVTQFPHAVAPAWYWPAEQLGKLVGEAGFAIESYERRENPGARRHGAVHAYAI